jgi:hypothetical protein
MARRDPHIAEGTTRRFPKGRPTDGSAALEIERAPLSALHRLDLKRLRQASGPRSGGLLVESRSTAAFTR